MDVGSRAKRRLELLVGELLERLQGFPVIGVNALVAHGFVLSYCLGGITVSFSFLFFSFLLKTLARLIQRRHVDDEAILHIALEHPLIRFVDLLDRNHFDGAGDPVLGAEIQHLLRLLDSSDERPGELSPALDQAERIDWGRLRRHAYQCHRAVAFQQSEIRVEIVFRRNRIDDEVEAVRLLLHFLFVFRYDYFVRAEPFRILPCRAKW